MARSWRVLLSRLSGRARALGGETQSSDDVFERPSDAEPSPTGPLDLALDEIEAGALEVYAKAALPIEAGHYRKAPGDDSWTFIAVRITPEARFALALEHPAELGWRFGRLQDLGARSDLPELRAASRLLSEIADLRDARRGVLTPDHLLIAMELGGAWRALRDSKALRASRLTLTPPDAGTPDVVTPAVAAPATADLPPAKTPRKPRAKRDKSPKPR